MEEDPRPYFASRQSAIRKIPVAPPLRKCSAFPHKIPEYRKRNVSKVVEKCGIEILGLITCNIKQQTGVKRSVSVKDLYNACLENGVWRSEFNCYNSRKTGGLKDNLAKVAYAEILIKI